MGPQIEFKTRDDYLSFPHFLDCHHGSVGNPVQHDIQALLPSSTRIDSSIVDEYGHLAKLGLCLGPECLPVLAFGDITSENQEKMIT